MSSIPRTEKREREREKERERGRNQKKKKKRKENIRTKLSVFSGLLTLICYSHSP